MDYKVSDREKARNLLRTGARRESGSLRGFFFCSAYPTRGVRDSSKLQAGLQPGNRYSESTTDPQGASMRRLYGRVGGSNPDFLPTPCRDVVAE